MADVTKEVGFNLTVTGEDLDGAIDKSKKSLKGFKEESKKTKKEGKSAMDTIRGGLDIVFKATELAARAWEVLSSTISDSIQTALAFRRANDPIVLWFKRMAEATDRLKARIGDVLLPVIQGFTDGLLGNKKALEGWIKANKEVIQTGLVEWIGAIAKGLTIGLGTAIIFIRKAIFGWQIAFKFVQSAMQEGLAKIMLSLSNFLFASGKVTESFDKDLSRALIAASGQASETYRNMWLGARKSEVALAALTEEMEAGEKTIRGIQKAVVDAIDKGMVAALKRAKETADGLGMSLEHIDAQFMKFLTDTEKIANAQLQFNQAVRDLELGNLERLAEIEAKELVILEERRALLADMGQDTGFLGSLISAGQQIEILNAEMERGLITSQEFADAMLVVGQSLVDSFAAAGEEFGTLLAAVIAGQITMEQALQKIAQSMLINILTFVENAILAFAVQAAAGQLAAHAFLPFVGIAVGAAAAATIFGLVKALIAQVPTGMKEGGEVSGGTQGQDSVLALLTPGERVLTVDENRTFKKLISSISSPRTPKEKATSSTGFQTGGIVGRPAAAAAGGGVSINISAGFIGVPTSTQRKRFLLDMAKDAEELFEDGKFMRNAAKRRE